MGGVFNPLNLGMYSYTQNNPVKFVDPDGSNAAFVAIENFILVHAPEINAAVQYASDAFGGTHPNNLLGLVYNFGPELTNALLVSVNTLGDCIVNSAVYLMEDAAHDIINGGIPLLLDTAVDSAIWVKEEWIRQNMPTRPQEQKVLYFEQRPLEN